MNVIRSYAVSQQQAVQGFKNAGFGDTPLIPPNTGPNTTGAIKTSKPIQSGVANPVGGPTLFGTLPSHSDSGQNPSSGCNNCNSDYLNPANWACQLGKLSCEFTHSIGGTFGDFSQYLPYIIIGGAAILLIILIKR